MNMVTYFNRKDMVGFGNYLLSEERKQKKIEWRDNMIREGMNPPPIEDLMDVSHADVENWLHKQSKKG